MLQERGDRAFNTFINVVLVLFGLIILYPLWYVVICSFSDPGAIITGEVFLWPVGFTMEGYEAMTESTELWTGYANTILYTGVCSLLGLAMQLTCAYALSRKQMPGRGVINMFFMITMYFSGGMIPFYMLMADFDWINTRWVMMIPGAFSMWNVIVARSYFMGSIPDSLFDAARIDGCGYFRFFLKVVLPLSTAMIAIIALYNMQAHWNSYLTGQIYLMDNELFTVQQVIVNIQNATQSISQSQGVASEIIIATERKAQLLRYTSIIVAAIPMIAMYPFVQKYIVKGVMVGAVKG